MTTRNDKRRIEHRISDGGIETLRTLIGRSVSTVLSPGVWVEPGWVDAMSFLIRLTDGFLVFSSNWVLTPEEELTIHDFDLTFSIEPTVLQTITDENDQTRIVFPFSEIRVGAPKPARRTIVNKIVVYETESSGTREEVIFDSAIRLFREDRMELLLAAEESVRGGVTLSYSKSFIRGFIDGKTPRLRIE